MAGDPYAKFIKSTVAKEQEIRARIDDLALRIKKDYGLLVTHESPLILIGVLKGAYIFVADLARALSGLNVPNIVEFIGVSSYGSASSGTGEVRVMVDLRIPIKGKHCLIVEDIIGSGDTMSFLRNILAARVPASLRFAALIDKSYQRNKPFIVDYVGISLAPPDVTIAGYGIDFNEQLRGYKDIVVIDAAALATELKSKL